MIKPKKAKSCKTCGGQGYVEYEVLVGYSDDPDERPYTELRQDECPDCKGKRENIKDD